MSNGPPPAPPAALPLAIVSEDEIAPEDDDNYSLIPAANQYTVSKSGQSIRRWHVFETYCEMKAAQGGCTDQQAADAVGIGRTTILKFKRTEWWRDLEDEYLRAAQGRFIAKLASKGDSFADGLVAVAEGRDPDSKIANAQVGAARLFGELGRKGNLLPKQPHVQVTHDNRTITHVEGAVVNIEKLGSEAVRDFLRTGKPPPQIVNPK